MTQLTHWGWVTHICIIKLTIIGSDNGLSPGRPQAIIWTNAGILLIGPLGTNFSEILIEIQTFSLKKIRLKVSSAKCCSFHLGLNVLTHWGQDKILQIYFLEWKINFDSNFPVVCSHWSNKKQASIGSNNGLLPNRQQTIIWTNDGPVAYMLHSASLSKNITIQASVYPNHLISNILKKITVMS